MQLIVIPAKAGTQKKISRGDAETRRKEEAYILRVPASPREPKIWVPAFAGMTGEA
jgi:hypothetical protein